MVFVEDLNGLWFFESMYVDDFEVGKFGVFFGMEEIFNAYFL